jgi:hypothetical protein
MYRFVLVLPMWLAICNGSWAQFDDQAMLQKGFWLVQAVHSATDGGEVVIKRWRHRQADTYDETIIVYQTKDDEYYMNDDRDIDRLLAIHNDDLTIERDTQRFELREEQIEKLKAAAIYDREFSRRMLKRLLCYAAELEASQLEASWLSWLTASAVYDATHWPLRIADSMYGKILRAETGTLLFAPLDREIRSRREDLIRNYAKMVEARGEPPMQ